MKYIRTKDRVIDLTHWSKTEMWGIDENNNLVEKDICYQHQWLTYSGDACYLNNETISHNKQVIKEADTIEELCDEFVVVRKDGETEIMDDSEVDFHIREGFYPTEDTEETYYGAVWTDKGLIYVAKINDKGELELL